MPRQARVAPGGFIYHVSNRSVANLPLFRKEADYAAFEQLLLQAQEKHPTRILAWSLMKTHWQIVLWPKAEGELTAFIRWLTQTHAIRWHHARGTAGGGHLYQSRFKAFPIEKASVFTVLHHVERAALSAEIVDKAQDWRWGSLWVRRHPEAPSHSLLSGALGPFPTNWTRQVNAEIPKQALAHLEPSLQRGRPFGRASWQARIIRTWGLQHTLRPPGRPRIHPKPEQPGHK